MRREFYYLSGDGKTRIHAMEWIPIRAKAILQISHGMAEYIERYDEFANYLCNRGYYVVGQDHLGHGKSVTQEDDLGFFHEEKGNEYVITDIHTLRKIAQKKYPDVPYFMLGHSMGSFLVRQYVQRKGRGVSGAIIMGTSSYAAPVLCFGKLLCFVVAKQKGWKYRSSLINRLGLGSYNRKFQDTNTSVDWISKDEAIVEAYINDPLCTFMYTVNGYYHLFDGLLKLNERNIKKIPKELPLFFVSGEKDAVGDFGRKTHKAYMQYKNCGVQDVTIKLYPEDRHEILNETDRTQVYEDLYRWLEKKSRG